jgi:DNA repair exonuclease SbcCD ATPase subunit
MLKSITTKNFKKLASGRFDFTPDLNIICGDNAKGKTTVTQALMFALFGVKAVPGSADKIPTWGEKDCEVTVVMAQYTIIRTLKNCKVLVDNTPVATGNSVCSAYIEENITGTDLKGFRMLNWSAQGETSALLTIGSTQLQRDVERFSGVEFIDEMIKLAGTDLRDLKRDTDSFADKRNDQMAGPLEIFIGAGVVSASEIESRTKEVTDEHAELTKNIAEEQDDSAKTAASKAESQRQLEVGEQGNQKAEQNTREVLVAENTLGSAVASEALYSATAKSLAAELAELGEIESEGELDERERDNNKAIATNTEIARVKESSKSAQKILNNCVAGILSDDKLAKKVTSAKSVVDQLREDYAKISPDAKSAQALVTATEQALASGVCSSCKQSIVSEESKAAHVKELQSAKDSLKPLLAKLAEIESEAAIAKPIFDAAYQDYDNGYEDWHKQQTDWENTLEANDVYLETATWTDTDAESKLLQNDRKSQTLATSLQKQINDNAIALEIAERNIDEANANLAKLHGLSLPVVGQLALQTLRDEIKQFEIDFNESRDLINGAKIQLSEMATEIKQLGKALADELEFQEKLGRVKTLSDFVQYLKDSRSRFLTSVWANILGAASGFLMQSTNNSITALMRSEKEGFMYCEDGVFAPVESASGMQRGFIGVAVRLALAKSLRSSCALVVLDEPTESMREEPAMRLSGALLGNEQVLMVTHRESDKGVATNIVEL